MDVPSASSAVAQHALNLAIMVVKHLSHAAPGTPDSSAARQFEDAKLRVGMRWSVLTTKALSLRSGHKGSVTAWCVPGTRLLADHHLLHGAEHKKHKGFAHACLEALRHSSDQDLRAHLRKMVAEWLRLAGQMR
jgi:hypothetical protein